jgi:membrane protein implicated in regulation of membrane protease activity
VTQRVDDLSGQVKIGGELWSARAFMEGEIMEPGARVEVAKIEGATALVYQ